MEPKPYPIYRDGAAELEQTRLRSLVALVWDGDHYHVTCSCHDCAATRDQLSPEDLDFIDTLSRTIVANNHADPELY